MQYTHSNLSDNFGAIIEPISNFNLSAIQKNELFQLLSEYGVLLFRGFDLNLDQASQFVVNNSSHITGDPARKTETECLQLIESGHDAIGFHCENGNTPFLPDFLWFYCERSASAGSETTVCDGYKVWDALKPSTKSLLLKHKLKYCRNFPEHLWKKYILCEFSDMLNYESVTEEHLLKINELSEGQTFKLNADRSAHSTFVTPAAHRTLFSERIAFSNSLLGPSYNYEKPKITLDNNQEIDSGIMSEIQRITDEFTVDIQWRDNELLLIDNTRVMHGRRKILDTNRKIYAAISYFKTQKKMLVA